LGYHTLTPGVSTHSSANDVTGNPYGWRLSTDGDWAGFARLGYRLNPNWRIELEGGYRKGDVTSFMGASTRAQPIGLCDAGTLRTAAAPNCRPPHGNLDAWSFMGNVIYDFLPSSR
ncbi:hypothetical protein ACNJU9_21220, partial [Mycobacterium tuberculosis]